ncbi:MAG: phosphatidate cytidylyltransferase [Candidatus Scalinduaceae bacterium]
MTVLNTRIVFGTAMLAAFFGIIFLDYVFDSDIGLGLLGMFVGGIALWEFYNLVEKNAYEPFKVSGIIWGIVVFVGFWLSAYEEGINPIFPSVFVLIILWLFAVQALKQETSDTIKNISVTIFGIIYTFFFLSFVMPIRHMPNGLGIILSVLLITKGGDIGGYLFGSRFGKHRLSSFSPNKTIEGALFGLFCSLIIAIGLNMSGIQILPLSLIIPFGLLVGASGIFGDLIESIMKRDADVKDSGNFIPAFGGILDILDSLLISIPVAYYFFVIMGY